jgi:hypothetical protein
MSAVIRKQNLNDLPSAMELGFLDLPNMHYSEKVFITKPLRSYLERLTLAQRNTLVSTIYEAVKRYNRSEVNWKQPITFAKNRAKLASVESKVYTVVECIYKVEDLAKVCICANSFMHFEHTEQY